MGNLYSSLKIFRFPDKLASLSREVGLIKPPVHVRIKPTNRCNHRCRYCAYRTHTLQLGEQMGGQDQLPREVFLALARDLTDMGVRAVTFSGGGEPLLHPDLPEAVRMLACAGVRLAAITNGSRLHGEIAELLAWNASWVRVSVDGWDADSYARYRRVDLSAFDRLLQNLAAFKRLGGRCRLGVSLIVDRENAAHVTQAVQTFHGAGVDSIKISPCIVSNSGAETNAYHNLHFDLVKDQVTWVRKALSNPAFEIFDAFHHLAESFDKDFHWCPFCQILPVVGADQTVYTCQDKAYTESGKLGFFADQGFRRFWFADKARFFRVDPARDCGHHCVAETKIRLILDYHNLDPEHADFV